MNFNKITTRVLVALLPFLIITTGEMVQAMDPPAGGADKKTTSEDRWGGLDPFDFLEMQWKEEDKNQKDALGIKMEPRYFTEDYNQEYELNDLRRIVKGTFDVSKYFKNGIISRGPWRWMAYKKSESDPKFKEFINQIKREYESKLHARIIGSSLSDYYGILDKIIDPNFIRLKTENESFEKFVDECRRDWNRKHDYKSKVKNYEDAFKKALLILSPDKEKDPFWKRRVEVLHDEKGKVYLVKRTVDSRPFMGTTGGGFYDMLLHENGDVIYINGK